MNHIDVMQKALEALLSATSFTSKKARDSHGSTVTALREALAAPGNQLDDNNVADMEVPQPATTHKRCPYCDDTGDVHTPAGEWRGECACHYGKGQTAPNSVEIDGIKTEPAQQIEGSVKHTCPMCEESWYELEPQQEPDFLHLAAMDLARKQMDRIAELEAEVARFRTDAMNEKAARQELEQQLAARVPLTDEQIKDLCKVPWVFDTARQWVRIIEAAHGITKGAA